jgi:hypothetical protein
MHHPNRIVGYEFSLIGKKDTQHFIHQHEGYVTFHPWTGRLKGEGG